VSADTVREALRELVDVLNRDPITAPSESFCKAFDRARAALREDRGTEPVAWLYRWPDGTRTVKLWIDNNRGHATMTPLYAAPIPEDRAKGKA